jgi:hypothetical protein
MSDDELFSILSEIADEEIMAQNRSSIIEVGRRIIGLAANGAEPIYQVREDRRSDAWKDCSKDAHDHMAKYPACFETRIVYTAPVASGPRYDWSVSGMKQSETGNWVMAGSAEKTGE